jgi:multisubunit Na+/H+ antiporter MnhB subunit
MFEAPEWLWWVMVLSPMILTPVAAHLILARTKERPGLGGMMGIGALGAVPLALFMAATRPDGGIVGGLIFALVVLAVWGSTIGVALASYVDWLRREDAKRRPVQDLPEAE